MTLNAQVLVIGGGAMGVSLLYHLAKAGWSDLVLTEKNDLTHGSTWHAAGLCTHFAHNPTIQELRATSVRLYRDILPAETGDTCGFHRSGAMRITTNPDRMDEFAHVAGLSKFTGYDLQLITRDDVERLHPLARTEGLLGGIYEPDDGHVDPTLATSAMAKVARSKGATILRQNPVVAIRREVDHWTVETAREMIRARHIVNAAGTWGWEVGHMMGLNIPSVPVLHQYLVTDTVPAVADRIAGGLPELPMIRDPEESWYVRQERDGLILGPYEKDAQPWSIDGVPPEFGAELMAPDLDRVEHIIMAAMARIPALETGGIKSVVNGPITFTPDANPLIGPAHGLPNAWLLTGSSMGVMEGGGAGWFLARWMTHGAPPMDALAVDSRRFGHWADRDYRVKKAVECFGLQFGVHYPHEERLAARGKRLSALHDRMLARGAVMGAAHGWERPNWLSDHPGDDGQLTFRRANWFPHVAREVATVTNAVGLADLSVFSKFEVAGPDARAYVDSLGANRPPKEGRIGLTHALTPAGGTQAEFTVSALAGGGFYLTSAAAAEEMDEDILRDRAGGFDVSIGNLTNAWGVIGLMGPKSRAVLSSLTDADLGAGFPWLSVREIVVAGIAARALRVSYVGELGWELHAKREDMPALFDALEAAGRPHGLGFFGAYAMNSMRLEKGYPAWGADFTTERTPAETGVGALIRPEGRDFIGRAALLARMEDESRWEMVLLSVATGDVDPFYSHVVMQGGGAGWRRHLSGLWSQDRAGAGAGLSPAARVARGVDGGNPRPARGGDRAGNCALRPAERKDEGMTRHPIIAMWSHPRSMSTAVERIMRERGDLDCLHEPFMYDYYVHRRVRMMPHFDVQPDHPVSYGAIRDMLVERADRQPVFIKDMSYYVMPQILADKGFAARLTNVFLVRDPVASIPSYYKLDPDLTLEEVGLEAQARHFDALAEATGVAPPVIVSEDVRSDPEGVMGALWRRIGLPHVAAAFDWQNAAPKDWAQVGGWHGDVTSAKGIRPLSPEERAAQQQSFDALAEKVPHLRGYLDHHRPFYGRLAARAIR